MNDKWEILHGDALKLLGGFAPGAFDAVITDPPYASGGRTQAEKNKSTAKKYSSMGDHAPPPFDGDAKDRPRMPKIFPSCPTSAILGFAGRCFWIKPPSRLGT